MTYTVWYLEPGEGLTFSRRVDDPNLEQDEDAAVDILVNETWERGDTPLQIDHGNRPVWQARDIE